MRHLYRIVIASLIVVLALPAGTLTADATAVNCADTTTTGVPQAQCEALVDLYNSTGGAGWSNSTNWLSSGPVKDWYGISVNSGYVSAILLGNNNLVGQIPGSIGSFPQAGILELQGNYLSGSIPASISGNGGLQTLNLSSNDLTGTIPSTIFGISPLKYLYLSDNQLSGNLDALIFNSSSLQTVQIYSNQITGPLPEVSAENLTLKEINLYGNQISGPIPASIANLKALTGLFLSDNQLSGPIPEEISQMTALTYLYLGANNLTGAIPPEIFTSTMIEIQIVDNQLHGPIPAEISNAVSMRKFYAGQNYLSGPIPASIGGLGNLQRIWLEGNDLYGPVPVSVLNLTNLMSSAGFLVGGNGLWTTNSGVDNFLKAYDTGWAGSQGPQGVLPAEGDFVGWGDPEIAEDFYPILRFSKQFNNAGVAAPVYLVEVKDAVSGSWILQKEVDGTDVSICPVSDPLITPVLCEYHPLLSDFSSIPVPGEYYWKISAAFEKDASEAWMWINIDGAKTFRIAEPPIVIYPTNITTKSLPTFKWSVVPFAESYNFVILNQNGSEKFNTDILVSACSETECTYTPSPVNLGSGNYTWKIRADMGGGDYTAWGDASFTKAEAPTPKFPSTSATTTNPKFIWSPVAGQTRYQIQLFTSTGAKKLDKTFDTSVCGSTTCSYTPSSALNLANGAYKWKVRAGDAIEWGDYSIFKIFNKVTPPAPLTPSGSITVTNPKFTWKKIPGATKYYIQLQKSTGALVKNIEVKILSCTATTCSYTPSPALNLAKGQYKWRVRAFNGYYGPYGVYISFTKK